MLSAYTPRSRSDSGTSRYPTIRREEAVAGEGSDEERGSGEYYSGEDFQEDDIILARDRRYCFATTALEYLLSVLLHTCSKVE